MKKIIAVYGGIFFILLSFLSSASASGHKTITSDELKKMMESGPALKIVDVREPELFRGARIPGAINIPYDGAQKRILKELNPGERIVFVCHGGPMGDELAQILAKNGYKDVYNLKGGMRKWPGPYAG